MGDLVRGDRIIITNSLGTVPPFENRVGTIIDINNKTYNIVLDGDASEETRNFMKENVALINEYNESNLNIGDEVCSKDAKDVTRAPIGIIVETHYTNTSKGYIVDFGFSRIFLLESSLLKIDEKARNLIKIDKELEEKSKILKNIEKNKQYTRIYDLILGDAE